MAGLPIQLLRHAGRVGRVTIFVLTPVGLLLVAWLLAPSAYRLPVEGALVLLLLLLLCVLVFPKLIAPAHTDDSLHDITDDKERLQLQDDRLKLQNDVRTALLQAIGGAALIAGLVFTWQEFQTNRDQLNTNRDQLNAQLDLTRRGQVAERFTRAIDQLGSGSVETRLGGIYGLEQIANDSLDQRLVVIEVLVAYVRERAPWPPRLPGQPAKDTPIKQIPELQSRAPDVQAAMTVLGRRKQQEGDPETFLRSVDLRKADLSGAQLQGIYFGGANLQDATLSSTNLDDAALEDVNLQDAYLRRATFRRAHLLRANLQGTDIRYVSFEGATLDGANLKGAHGRHARFQDASADRNTTWPTAEFDWRSHGIRGPG